MLPLTLRRLLLLVLAHLVLAGTAAAQVNQQPSALLPSESLKGIKHQISFMASGGFDLDVLGDVVNAALGSQVGNTQAAVKRSQAWPDVYVTVPKRPEFSVGYGLFQHNEVFARFSRATYTSDEVTDAGNIVAPGSDQSLNLRVSDYREHSWEVGWRHYMTMTRRAKQYGNITYGRRIVDPISTVVTAGDRPPQTLQLYDRSNLWTFSLEMGLTFEFAHAGLFAQVGGRWQQRLVRNDVDLAPLGLEAINNTGLRFYMPLQFGVLFRL